MNLDFRKVSNYKTNLNYEDEGICFNGEIEKISKHKVLLNGTLKAEIELFCNRCAKEFTATICEDLQLTLTDIPTSIEDLDTIECLDKRIDIQQILMSELETFKNDYNYCEDCNSDEEYEIEI